MQRGFICSALVLSAVLLGGAARMSIAAAAPSQVTAWDLQPYRVTLLLAIDPTEKWPQGYEARLTALLRRQVAANLGGLWRLTTASAPVELRHKALHRINDVTAAELQQHVAGADKVLIVSLSKWRHAGADYRILARELDVTTQLWNASVERAAHELKLVPAEAFFAVRAAFGPLGRIETLDAGQVKLRLRGGSLGSGAQLLPGQVLRPILISQGASDGEPETRAEIPWTWLTPQSTSGALVTCALQSGLVGAAVPNYHPRRQRLALAVTPPTQPSELQVVSSGEKPAPLDNCQVFAISAAARDLLGITDRRGMFTVAPGPRAVRQLSIERGGQVLARLPIVPGIERRHKIICLPDSARMAWEASLVDLREELLDFVCRREGLLARARASISAGNKQLGQSALDELKTAQDHGPWLAAIGKQRERLASLGSESRPEMAKQLDELEQLLAKYTGATKSAVAPATADNVASEKSAASDIQAAK